MNEETKTIITVGLLVFAALAWVTPLAFAMKYELEAREKRGEPPQYDERQKIARLRAGNHALFALLGLLLVWTAADQFGCPWTGSMLDMTLSGMILAWGVWAADCILHDAFVTWKDKRKDADLLALVYCWMLFTWTSPHTGMQICESWLPFIFSCAYVVILLGIIIYKARKRKKTEAGDSL